MRIEPLAGIVYIRTESAKAGVLDTSSRESAVEFGEVVEVGDGINEIKKGDKIFVKSWAVDIINHNGEWYKFVNRDTKGILAIVHE